MKKSIFILITLLTPYFLISQDCYDDDFTMQVGLSAWTSGINGCEDGINFLENAGYPCSTTLNTINNPFWGSNTDETLANICGCTCENQSIIYCQDNNACNYGEIGECEYIQIEECDCDGNFPDLGYDCNGNCLNDTDEDGVCNEAEISGCTDSTACNYDSTATDDDSSCTYPVENYLDCNGNCLNDTDSDGVCDEIEISGCTDSTACNYYSMATDDDSSCEYPDLYYIDCDGNCLHDFDQDGICDELETNPCEQYPNPGPCFAAVTVYFFNQQNSQCEETIWGGCDGLVPFWTLEECQNQCEGNSFNLDLKKEKKIINSFNILGQKKALNGFIIDVYDDGTYKKKIK